MKAQESKFHIIYIITKLELGGAQKVCLSLFDGINQAGYSSSLISGTHGPLVEHVKDKTSVYLLPTFQREVSYKVLYNEIKNFLQLIKHLKQLAQQFPNLIVHTHSTKAGLVGRWAAFFAGIKKRVHTIHGYAFHPHQSKLVWVAIYLLELVTSCITTHFVCVSSADVQTGAKLFPQFKKKYSIIRAAVEWEKFYNLTPLPQPQQKLFILGTIACFKKQKNLADLIKAFHYAYQKNNQLRLEIIGDGILRSTLEQLIQHYELNSVVTLHGWQNNVAHCMLTWNAFVLTSLWEGLPCSIIEARLLKLPVLSYNTGGIGDVIVNNKNGFLYKQKDWQSFAQGILDLSTNKELYQKLHEYNEDLSDYSNQVMISKHIDLYREYI